MKRPIVTPKLILIKISHYLRLMVASHSNMDLRNCLPITHPCPADGCMCCEGATHCRGRQRKRLNWHPRHRLFPQQCYLGTRGAVDYSHCVRAPFRAAKVWHRTHHMFEGGIV